MAPVPRSDDDARSPDLTDRVAVVTGASGSIGGALCLALVRSGSVVCAVGRDQGRLEKRLAASPTDTIRLYTADLTDDEQIENLVSRIRADVGRIDMVIHSAATISLGPVAETPVEELDHHYRTNLRAPFLLTQLALPALLETEGTVVFVNSTAGLRASANQSQYAATKHALKALADSLRAEVNAAGIRVLTVYPGRTAGQMQKGLHAIEERAYRPVDLEQPEDVAAAIISAMAIPRTTEITDIQMRPFRKPT